MFAKLMNQGVAAALFSLRHPKNLQNEKNFIYLKIAEIDMGGQFWVEKNDSGQKTHFLKLNPFSGGKWLNLMTYSLLPREIL